MNRALFVGLFLIVTVAGCSREERATEHAENHEPRDAHWGYEGNEGPSNWATLSEAYADCGEGRSQSPIDIREVDRSKTMVVRAAYDEAPLTMSHNEHMEDIIDNGHTIQIDFDQHSIVEFDGVVYELQQFHFHTPSEHTLNGERFPMEMHLVHRSETGALAVFAVVYEEGDHNPAYAHIVDNLPDQAGEARHVEGISVELDDLMPHAREGYAYSGSLTTPPCSERVAWFVANRSVKLSHQQLAAFTDRLEQNNRPIQPLNTRLVTLARIELQ